jgi:two-component system response regulator CiaR
MKKILVIEDTQEIIDLMVEILKPNFEVITALDGKKGLKLMLSETFDLIITDQNMPHYTGLEVIEEAKRFNITTPIFLHTSDDRNFNYRPTYQKLSEHMFKAIAKLLEEE